MTRVLVTLVLTAGCVADGAVHPQRTCDATGDCAAGEVCYRGFCVPDEPVERDAGGMDATAPDDSGGEDDAAGRRDAGWDAATPPADAGTAECAPGDTVPCYEGPPETADVGACRSGLRTCVDGEFGACDGQVLPTTETCNGTDDDCDESTDEDFSLDSDPMHCGACMRACPADLWCCAGTCLDVGSNRENCGGCGIACRPPERTCCAGTCRRECG